MVKDIGFMLADRYKLKEPLVYTKFLFGAEAKIAIEMVQKWGLIAAIDDGEDSAGRHRVRMMTIGELVQRACDSAQKLIEEFEKREWFLELPEPQTKDIP